MILNLNRDYFIKLRFPINRYSGRSVLFEVRTEVLNIM
jgi:hypothetical protein